MALAARLKYMYTGMHWNMTLLGRAAPLLTPRSYLLYKTGALMRLLTEKAVIAKAEPGIYADERESLNLPKMLAEVSLLRRVFDFSEGDKNLVLELVCSTVREAVETKAAGCTY
jgi:hypothetical protein